jgi:hypothetical protein
MKQSRKKSFIEANINTLVGIPINYGMNSFLFSRFQNEIIQNDTSFVIAVTGVFTVVSVLRNYLVRRFFA